MALKDIVHNVRNNLRTVKKTGHGPASEANHGWVDNKPYTAYWSDGTFEGYDNTLHKYYKFPLDVKTNWVSDPNEILQNQDFFNQIMRELGKALDGQTERTRNDVRRKFHIVMSMDLYEGIPIYPGCSPAHKSYLERASKEIIKPQWFGYMGFQLNPSNLFYDTHSVTSMVSKWFDFVKNPEAMQYEMYREDINFLDEQMLNNGFRPISFLEQDPVTQLPGQRDFEQLTAWHGISDLRYNLERRLENIRFSEFTHGKSLLVPKSWTPNSDSPTEISFSAIRPKVDAGMFMSDPQSNFAQFMTKPLMPKANVVSISIRGEIRSGRVADNMLEQKVEARTRKSSKRSAKRVDQPYDMKTLGDISKIDTARSMVGGSTGSPFLDNVEIVVGQIVNEHDSKLNPLLKEHGLEAVPLINRQPDALLSTLPAYPNQIHRIRSGNTTRSVMTNQMLPGILGFSGIFRSTRPAEPYGIFLGHDDSNTEFREIYTSVEASNRTNNVPGFLITGRPGSGKTQTMLQIIEQAVYQGYSAFFMNPKKEATLQPVFDHLGGVTISMSTRFLMDHPGCLDPVFFFDALVPNDGSTDILKRRMDMRIKVAETLSDAIFTGLKWKYNRENVASMTERMTNIKAQITNNAANFGNTCSSHIIFGNPASGTEPIQDDEIIKYVTNVVQHSAFWKALISNSGDAGSVLQKQMMQNRAVLMEWDGSLRLPGVNDKPEDYDQNQIESLLSVQFSFIYASNILGQGRSGGVLGADESWVFRNSAEINAILDTGMREWRQANIMMMMGTQNIGDWVGSGESGDMSSFFSRILMMAVNEQSQNELDLFFRLSKLPDTPYYRNYIINAGSNPAAGQPVPRGYYIDNINKYRGPLILGPYPELELSLGRTDKSGEQARAAKSKVERDHGSVLQGTLAEIVDVHELLSEQGWDSSVEGLHGHREQNLYRDSAAPAVGDSEEPPAHSVSTGGAHHNPSPNQGDYDSL